MSQIAEVAGCVVVGYDGSPRADEAARWATAWAKQRQRTVVLLSAISPLVLMPGDLSLLPEIVTERAGWVQKSLDQAAASLDYPDLRTMIIEDSPARVLAEASAHAELTVIGTRGLGPVAGLFLGSVASTVISHARGALAVVPEAATQAKGPVILGFDGSEHAMAAADFALAAAQEKGSPLVVLHIVQQDQSWGGAMPLPDGYQQTLTDQFTSQLAGLAAHYPRVDVEFRIAPGDPPGLLAAASRKASLLVVGSRGTGGFTGLLLGSTSRKVLQHTHCPSVVIHV